LRLQLNPREGFQNVLLVDEATTVTHWIRRVYAGTRLSARRLHATRRGFPGRTARRSSAIVRSALVDRSTGGCRSSRTLDYTRLRRRTRLKSARWTGRRAPSCGPAASAHIADRSFTRQARHVRGELPVGLSALAFRATDLLTVQYYSVVGWGCYIGARLVVSYK
jgi:hypothetical protein